MKEKQKKGGNQSRRPESRPTKQRMKHPLQTFIAFPPSASLCGAELVLKGALPLLPLPLPPPSSSSPADICAKRIIECVLLPHPSFLLSLFLLFPSWLSLLFLPFPLIFIHLLRPLLFVIHPLSSFFFILPLSLSFPSICPYSITPFLAPNASYYSEFYLILFFSFLYFNAFPFHSSF